MYHSILVENQNKRREIPLWQLLCFVMFCVWQMGFIYYVGPALNIDGRTPLPISADNLTLLIVAGYVLSIITMIFLPKGIIRLSRAASLTALLSAVGLFFPLSTTLLTLLIYIQCFCCCYMIGFESATMVHHFTQESVTRHLLIAYPIGYTMIALIQSDFIAMDFSTFRILTVIMLLLLLLFYYKLSPSCCINFVRKSDGLVLPCKFLYGFLLLAFLSALLGVIAPAAAAPIKHGVCIAYISCAFSSVVLYLLSLQTKRHPISYVSYIIGISAIGYVFLVVSEHLPFLQLIACALIGVGMSACALLPLFSLLIVKQYPSKFIVPGYIALAMLAVIVQSLLVEAFRSSAVLLNLAYLVVVIILTIIYVLVEPYLLYSMSRNFEDKTSEEITAPDTDAITENEINSDTDDLVNTNADILISDAAESENPLKKLTKRELEVLDLICFGHSNKDIAAILYLSEHTVKDHTKNIYRKLEVHSRFELAALIARLKTQSTP